MKFNKDIENYILNHIDEEDELLNDIYRQTHIKILRARMVSGHLQGEILKMICRMINPKKILEIGTFTGYSSMCMAQVIDKNATIDTIDINDEVALFAQQFFDKSPDGKKICQHIGNALDIVPKLNKSFDLIFIDGDKRQYPDYYKMFINLLNKGGYIIADNTLWSGKVIQPITPNDYQTKGIIEFNDLVKQDKNVEKVILPIRDGLTLIRKK